VGFLFPVPVPVRRGTVRVETAYAIAIFGGALVLLQAFFLATSLFAIGLLVGGSIVALGAAASFRPRERPALGVVIVLLGFGSFAVGGGFYLGAVLAIAGGALLAYLRTYGGATRPSSARDFSEGLGAPCPKCGKHIPTWAKHCPYCGFPDTE
jgi:hypothetical protein